MPTANIEPPPPIFSGVNIAYLRSVGKWKEEPDHPAGPGPGADDREKQECRSIPVNWGCGMTSIDISQYLGVFLDEAKRHCRRWTRPLLCLSKTPMMPI